MKGPEDDAGLAGKVALTGGRGVAGDGNGRAAAMLLARAGGEIKQHLSDGYMVELVPTIALYCGVVRVLATMKIDNELYYKEVLQQYPIPGVN